MPSCPDCEYVERQIAGSDRFEIIDIGSNVKNLKAFLRLRDSNPAFAGPKKYGVVGIPCFEREDGSLTLNPEDVGLKSRPITEGGACNLDGSGC